MTPFDYEKIIDEVRTTGGSERVRQMQTQELLAYQMSSGLGVFPWRVGLAPDLGLVEGLQCIAGEFHISAIKKAAPRADLSLFGSDTAYGIRLQGQLDRAIQILARDPTSRRATVVIARDYDVQNAPSPCTTSMQFLIRESALHMLVSMRSWDAVFGLPYDMMQFGVLGIAVANALGVWVGLLSVTAGSLHIYDSTRHLGAYQETKRNGRIYVRRPPLDTTWNGWVMWAREVLRAYVDDDEPIPLSEYFSLRENV